MTSEELPVDDLAYPDLTDLLRYWNKKCGERFAPPRSDSIRRIPGYARLLLPLSSNGEQVDMPMTVDGQG